MTREEADVMAMKFLRDHGPHTLPSPIETEEALSAAFVFLGLKSKGHATSTDFGGGHVQFSITDAGLAALKSKGV